MKSKQNSESFRKYNSLIHPERVHFMQAPGINFFMGQLDKRRLHAFLIMWTGFGIKMTEQVESWIKRAGEKCEGADFTEVGGRLKYHAGQEADHDQMLVSDLKVLIQKWNTIYNDNLTENDIFNVNIPASTRDYIDLHENTIAGEHPYAQVAIEYEIERMSVLYGPKMIENILCTLGEDFEDGLTFLVDHVLLDQGHTKFNIDLIERCFIANANLGALVVTGADALRAYAGFLNECITLSAKISEREQWKSTLTI